MALDKSPLVRTDLASLPGRTATAYNSFVLCEAYVSSICSDKESSGETNGFSLRLLRGGDKREGVRVWLCFTGRLKDREQSPFNLKHVCEAILAVASVKHVAPLFATKCYKFHECPQRNSGMLHLHRPQL